MTFNKYETSELAEPRVLTDDEKKIITDAFVAGKNIIEIKHEYFFPTSLIKNSIRHKKQTESYVVQLMKGLVVVTPEEFHFDEETMEKVIDVVEVRNTKPSTLVKLKTMVKEKYPDCTITDYNVDAIVSSATEAGTFTAFKTAIAQRI